MQINVITCDVRTILVGNWRPYYDPEIVQRELDIIRYDLHCHAIGKCGHSTGRLTMAAEQVLKPRLEAGPSPEQQE